MNLVATFDFLFNIKYIAIDNGIPQSEPGEPYSTIDWNTPYEY